MNPDPNSYQSPLSTRYASEAMRFNFSDQKKFTTWRRLWIALAEAEQELGLDIPDSALVEMRATVDELDLELAAGLDDRLAGGKGGAGALRDVGESDGFGVGDDRSDRVDVDPQLLGGHEGHRGA